MGFGGAVLTPARNLIMKNGDIPSQGEDGSCGVSIAGGRAGFPGARGPQGRAGSRGGGLGGPGAPAAPCLGGTKAPARPTLQTGPCCPVGGPDSPGSCLTGRPPRWWAGDLGSGLRRGHGVLGHVGRSGPQAPSRCRLTHALCPRPCLPCGPSPHCTPGHRPSPGLSL